MGSSDAVRLRTKLLSELVGTFAISFFGLASIVVGFLLPGLDSLQRLAFAASVPGITLAFDVKFLAKYSGSHVNPAITATFTTAGSFTSRLITPYIVFQIIGGLLAGFALSMLFDSRVPMAYLGSNTIAPGVSPFEAVLLEIVGTTILCLVVLYVVAYVRGAGRQGIIAGIVLSTLIFILGPISGGSFNPVRSFGPALFSGLFEGQYVYWIGPPIGGAIAGLVFKAFRKSRARN